MPGTFVIVVVSLLIRSASGSWSRLPLRKRHTPKHCYLLGNMPSSSEKHATLQTMDALDIPGHAIDWASMTQDWCTDNGRPGHTWPCYRLGLYDIGLVYPGGRRHLHPVQAATCPGLATSPNPNTKHGSKVGRSYR